LTSELTNKKEKTSDKRKRHNSGLLNQLASRYSREEIYQQIWSEPIQHVAKKYNVSDVYLARVCKKLNIPRPGRGYWAKKAAGKSMKQPVLPELSI